MVPAYLPVIRSCIRKQPVDISMWCTFSFQPHFVFSAHPVSSPTLNLKIDESSGVSTATCEVFTGYKSSVFWFLDETREESKDSLEMKDAKGRTQGFVHSKTFAKDQWKSMKSIACEVQNKCFDPVRKTVSVTGKCATKITKGDSFNCPCRHVFKDIYFIWHIHSHKYSVQTGYQNWQNVLTVIGQIETKLVQYFHLVDKPGNSILKILGGHKSGLFGYQSCHRYTYIMWTGHLTLKYMNNNWSVWIYTEHSVSLAVSLIMLLEFIFVYNHIFTRVFKKIL